MEKYHYLRKYVKHWKETHEPEHDGKLANLTIWFREVFARAGISDSELPEYLEWSDCVTEEWDSWGHNSRWRHVFENWYLIDCIDDAVELAKTLAEEFGDPDIDLLILTEEQQCQK